MLHTLRWFALALLVLVAACGGAAGPDLSSTTTPTTDPGTTTITTPGTSTTTTTGTVLPDPYFPDLGNPGFDVDHYGISITLDETLATFGTATTVIEATATSALTTFSLDLLGLTIDRLRVDDTAAAFERRGGEVIVTPATPLPAGEAFVVVVDYHGAPTTVGIESLGINAGWTVLDGTAYVFAEPDAAHTWFPGSDHPSDKATFTITATVPAGLTAVANGELVGTTAGAARVPEMLELFASWFGPYPFSEYGHVVVPGFPAAMETQTMTMMGAGFDAEEVVAHELAHQWFGDSVTPATWQHIWLNEGFATFGEFLWLEEAYGPAVMEGYAEGLYAMVAGPGSAISDPGLAELFGAGVYWRGGLTLYALRREVGDTTMRAILTTWHDRYRYGNATTTDFIAVAEEVSERDLGTFFAAWLGGGDLPALP